MLFIPEQPLLNVLVKPEFEQILSLDPKDEQWYLNGQRYDITGHNANTKRRNFHASMVSRAKNIANANTVGMVSSVLTFHIYAYRYLIFVVLATKLQNEQKVQSVVINYLDDKGKARSCLSYFSEEIRAAYKFSPKIENRTKSFISNPGNNLNYDTAATFLTNNLKWKLESDTRLTLMRRLSGGSEDFERELDALKIPPTVDSHLDAQAWLAMKGTTNDAGEASAPRPEIQWTW